MLICALDLETTGLDPTKDQTTEIGAVIWDTKLNAPIQFFNKLLKIQGPVPEFIVGLTGITDEMLSEYGEEPIRVAEEFDRFSARADFFMAHNAPFDKGFLEKLMSAVDVNFTDPGYIQWIDTSVDVDYPESISTRKLTHLAAEHGFVNPFAHRAMTDVLTMCQVASKYDWDSTIKTPRRLQSL